MTRSEKTALTTREIFEALRREILENGWDSVTIAGIARRAGRTVGAVYSRAENASELANVLWVEQLKVPFTSMVSSLVDSAGSGSVDAFAEAATAFDQFSKENSIIFDLAIASLFDDELAEVVQRDIRTIFGDHIRGSESAPKTPTHSAATALLLCFFMGRALAIRAIGHAMGLERAQLVTISGYWAAPEQRVDPDDVSPVVFLREPDEEEAHHLRLLQGVIEVLSRWGYRRATISRIARAAGMTPGAVLAGYGSKAVLVSAAASALVNSPAAVWQQYEPVVADLGPLSSRAAFLATFLDPRHTVHWKVNIELARVAESIPELESFRTPHTTLEHTHLGVMFVACFVDDLVSLPYAGCFTVGSAT